MNNTRPYMQNVQLVDAVAAAGEMKKAFLEAGLNIQTINRRLAVVRRVLNLSYEWDWLKEPLGKKISALMPSEKKYARHIYLDVETVRELLEHIDMEEVRKLIVGYCYTGLREAELLNLQPTSVVNGVILLDADTKAGRPRAVPIPENVKWVFNDLPFRCTYNQLRSRFEHARQKIGRPEIRIHDLRHTFASWLVMNPEVPLTAVRDLLGHSNLSVTSRYSHLRNDHLKDAAERLPKL